MDRLSLPNKSSRDLGQLHWIHWCVFALSLLVTLGAWYYAKTQAHEKIESSFKREAQKTIELITERMEKYEDVLWSGAGLFYASDSVTLNEWKNFAKAISIEKKYPGINGIGFIDYIQPEKKEAFLKRQQALRPEFSIHPSHDKPILMPITFIEPHEGNEQAVGLDMAHELNRYQAAIKAKDTGKAQITGPITLVQDSNQTPGFLFYVPVYENLSNEQRGQFKGLVYAPFVVKKLMEGTLSREGRHVSIQIQDGDMMMYNEEQDSSHFNQYEMDEEHAIDPNPLFVEKGTLSFYGRTWQYTLKSDMGFRAMVQNHQPNTILYGGLTIDFLLLALFFMMSRSHKKAVEYAKHATESLINKAEKLEKSNKELERFAYVASHDLKAPLRGIDNIVSWIIEDSSEKLDKETLESLEKVQKRIRRMENLIKGILDYAKINVSNKTTALVDTHAIFMDLQEEYGPSITQALSIEGQTPIVAGSDVHFKQVVDNLISNAIKYNDKESLKVKVYCIPQKDAVEFVVEDNGPGIEPRFHEKVFELFHTLHSKDEFESTGVGLSIVKKIVEENGGKIWIDASKEGGAQFHFLWPTTHNQGRIRL